MERVVVAVPVVFVVVEVDVEVVVWPLWQLPFGWALPSSPFISKQLVKDKEAAAASIRKNAFDFITN